MEALSSSVFRQAQRHWYSICPEKSSEIEDLSLSNEKEQLLLDKAFWEEDEKKLEDLRLDEENIKKIIEEKLRIVNERFGTAKKIKFDAGVLAKMTPKEFFEYIKSQEESLIH